MCVAGWSSNVHPASFRRCTKGWWSSRMNVELKVDSCSSLLEIISLRCAVTHQTHKHTLAQIHTQIVSFNSKSPRVVRVTAYVTGLNEQNKNKPRYHWRAQQTNSLKRLCHSKFPLSIGLFGNGKIHYAYITKASVN